jgi:hypothetical protein
LRKGQDPFLQHHTAEFEGKEPEADSQRIEWPNAVSRAALASCAIRR